MATNEELQEALDVVQVKFTEEFNAHNATKAELKQARFEADSRRLTIQTLRKGIEFYAPGPFWTEVVKDTKAAEDLGKHAEWVLRLTAGADDSGGA